MYMYTTINTNSQMILNILKKIFLGRPSISKYAKSLGEEGFTLLGVVHILRNHG